MGLLFGSKTESEVDVVSALKEDHKKVKELFDLFEEAEDRRSKLQIVTQTLKSLTVHAQVEEEIFYPAFRKARSAEDETDELMDEALQEHHVAKILMAELEDMSPGDKFYDAKYTVLAESVKHHIEEEESEIFPEVDEDEAAWKGVGERLVARREELMQGTGKSGGNRNGRQSGQTGRAASASRSTGRKSSAKTRR